jgi:hypothetical protein
MFKNESVGSLKVSADKMDQEDALRLLVRLHPSVTQERGWGKVSAGGRSREHQVVAGSVRYLS